MNRQIVGEEIWQKFQEGICPTCDERIKGKQTGNGFAPVRTEFRDELSRREHGISGMCQKCQDDTFGRGDTQQGEERSPKL